MKSGYEKIKAELSNFGREENGWRVSTNAFGDRAMFDGNWLMRAAAAMEEFTATTRPRLSIPCSPKTATATSPTAPPIATRSPSPRGLPPANAFWSVTMYDGKTQLLVANPLDRYLINSPMLPDLKQNADGSLTLYLQHDSPGADKESNWLPAPAGPIYVVMRLYWPKEEALNGSWRPPGVVKAD